MLSRYFQIYPILIRWTLNASLWNQFCRGYKTTSTTGDTDISSVYLWSLITITFTPPVQNVPHQSRLPPHHRTVKPLYVPLCYINTWSYLSVLTLWSHEHHDCALLCCFDSLITTHFHSAPSFALHTLSKKVPPHPPTCYQLVKIDFCTARHRQLFSLIKAERGALYLSKEDRFEVSSQDPLDILDPIMGPMGFVIHDIYQINCHTEKNGGQWPRQTHTSSSYCWERKLSNFIFWSER